MLLETPLKGSPNCPTFQRLDVSLTQIKEEQRLSYLRGAVEVKTGGKGPVPLGDSVAIQTKVFSNFMEGFVLCMMFTET